MFICDGSACFECGRLFVFSICALHLTPFLLFPLPFRLFLLFFLFFPPSPHQSSSPPPCLLRPHVSSRRSSSARSKFLFYSYRLLPLNRLFCISFRALLFISSHIADTRTAPITDPLLPHLSARDGSASTNKDLPASPRSTSTLEPPCPLPRPPRRKKGS